MKDFDKQLRPKRDEKNNSKIENITDNYDKIDYEDYKREESQNFLLTQLHVMKNFFSGILKKASRESKSIGKNKKKWIALKEALLDIGRLPTSKHPDVTLLLADSWNQIIEEHKNIDNHKIQLIIDSFKTYPGRNDHSLHFYLTRYSKTEWFPIPFFQILADIQKEYLVQKKNSHLDRWIALIDEIIAEG